MGALWEAPERHMLITFHTLVWKTIEVLKIWYCWTINNLNSGTRTPSSSSAAGLSTELLTLPVFFIIERKWRKDNRISCLSLFPSQSFGVFFPPGIVYILEIALFCCSFGFFHSTSPDIHWGLRCTDPTAERTGTPVVSLCGLISGNCPHMLQGPEIFKLAWFQEMWPKLVSVFSIYPRPPVCACLVTTDQLMMQLFLQFISK